MPATRNPAGGVGGASGNAVHATKLNAPEDKQAPIAKQAPARSWRDVLPVHPAADLFPLMSPDELKVLGEDIKENGLRTPIVLTTVTSGYRDDGRDHLLDGRNRLDAMERVGFVLVKKGKLDPHLGWEDDITLLPPRPCSVPESEAYMAAVSLNIHRRHLTSEQRRDLITKLIKATPEKSDRQIAEQVKASPTTVGTVRTKLEATGDVSKLDTRQDTKGRKQPAKKKRRTEDDYRRDLQAKKAAAPPVDADGPNLIIAAWDKASDERRQEFLQARHLQRKRGRPATGSKTPPQPKRKGGWPKGKPRKPRREAAE
jgi:hypothetical protein